MSSIIHTRQNYSTVHECKMTFLGLRHSGDKLLSSNAYAAILGALGAKEMMKVIEKCYIVNK